MPAPRINPKAYKKLISIRLPRYLIEFMDTVEGERADLIEAAMLDYYRLTKPPRDRPPSKPYKPGKKQ